MTKRIPVVHSTAIYDGRTHLGDVAELGNGQFAAVDANGHRLGVFDTRADAERLILHSPLVPQKAQHEWAAIAKRGVARHVVAPRPPDEDRGPVRAPPRSRCCARPPWRALSLSGRRILDRLEIELADHGGKRTEGSPCTYDDFERFGIHRHAIGPSPPR